MCTPIGTTVPLHASAKGRAGWFAADRAVIGYDHPVHLDVEHAVSVDVAATGAEPSARVAIELPVPAARALAEQLLAVAEAAERYEAATHG